MKQIYSFDADPPVVTEAGLRKELERRTLRRQIAILRFSSLLCCLCMALFAFFILRDSIVLSVMSIVFMTSAMIGNGIISVVFYRHGMTDHQ